MSLTDSKIRATKPSAIPFKLTDSHGLFCSSILVARVSGISNIVLTAKNPALHWRSILSSLCQRLATKRSSRTPEIAFKTVVLA